MTSLPRPAPNAGADDLVADLVEESEQVQALARSLDLPLHSLDPVHLLIRHLLSTLVHLATATATAAAVVDLADPLTPARLRALARIHSALSSLLSASGSMATALDQLAADQPVTDTAGLVQASRIRGAALLTSASAHLGAAAGLLRPGPDHAPAAPSPPTVTPAVRAWS
ncbi:hypothetical protein [Kitasatospora sp. NPDC057015]|uniref:hypothetical protein n=1 Tax=Kitasatospora sp. NPDC057015 TaxID=3346001 RepID=UPI003636D5FD